MTTLALEFPVKYLRTLQQLKWLSEGKKETYLRYMEVQQSLISAIPKTTDTPKSKWQFRDEMTQLLIKELQTND